LRMARSYRWAAWLSIILIVVGGFLQGAAVPLCFGLVIFSITGSSGAETLTGPLRTAALFIIGLVPYKGVTLLYIFIALLCFVYTLKCFAQGAQLYLTQLFAQRIIFILRGRLHAHLLRLSSSFFESRRTGDLMSRTTNDVSVLQNLVSVELVQAARAPAVIIFALVLMVRMSWQLTLLSLLVGPIVAYAISRGSRKMRSVTRQVQKRLGQLNTHLQERLSAIRVIQVFAREEHEINRFDEINEKNVRANLKVVKIGALLYPGVELIAFIGMMIPLALAGALMFAGKMQIPDLLTYLYCAQQTGSGLIRLGKIYMALQQALAAGERVFEILDTESEVQEAAQPIHLPRLQGQIEFEQVSFRYRTGEEVLNDINLRISPGEIVALVGRSGAGKTSLVNLIPRFYDPTAGQIELDGTDIRDVSLSSLRSQIGIVPQETFLFADTIHENIAYGRLEATREEVIQAAKAANADEFISNMDEGYDSAIGERGAMLSGGQRQRIAIARALLKDPRILILDEPTSSLDVKSEELVLQALARLMAGRTSLVIAHRPSTIKNADRILVLSDGRIAEEGSHRELIAAGGIYSHLYEGHFPSLPRAAEPS
ncbi:MAG: ATP-binding cassette domain-containing protein, partial [Armatimonadetes bacterium]|nr:ATP-binding cassette domain-containing protein [Armatimonadota bacterium]NIM23668.1 ATP-binding cassette domain-containing protein [Armatimonadota bacterium]NIM67539.1 ATP-binding cassette domain-containing protein [Armatimonadota bacterium]NIM76056.1 ATP-binding cassette domain-containing protein [Armatimonadota bacterium]NIN05726.1 ATP-binding cassette domain-containing protein [Armatimonadota bacterium]